VFDFTDCAVDDPEQILLALTEDVEANDYYFVSYTCTLVLVAALYYDVLATIASTDD